MKPTKRFPLLHLPDRWDWASITMQFQAVADAVWLGELIMFAAECREHARSS